MRRKKYRQCRSVQSIIGATQKRHGSFDGYCVVSSIARSGSAGRAAIAVCAPLIECEPVPGKQPDSRDRFGAASARREHGTGRPGNVRIPCGSPRSASPAGTPPLALASNGRLIQDDRMTALSKPLEAADDPGLVQQVQGGDTAAFAVLMRRYNRRL